MAGYIGSRASVVSSGAERKKTFAITGTTTVLTGLSYTPTFVHLFHNGVRLVDGTDYTATNGTSITLTSAAENGDEVVVISYATFQPSDTVSASAGGTFAGDVSVTGAATFSGPFTSLGIDDNAAATAVTIDASGNVGIGTNTPTALGTNIKTLEIKGGATDRSGGLRLTSSDSSVDGYMFSSAGLMFVGTETATPLAFNTAATERMRIDHSGNTMIATATPGGTGGWTFYPTGSGSSPALYVNKTNGSSTTAFMFQVSGVTSGSITYSSSSVAYNTSSDYRLKENITPVQGASDIVKAMKPCTYTFKSDGSWADGFLAHELQELHPRAVIGEKDAMKDEEYEVTPAVLDDDGNVVTEAVMGTRSVPDYQGVDYSKLTPILTAALQEALNKIDALEARLTALEATP